MWNVLWQPIKNFSALPRGGRVILLFLTEQGCRICAAIFSFIAGVMPPMLMFERSLLYIRSHCVANAGPLQCRFDVLVDPSVADCAFVSFNGSKQSLQYGC